MATYSLNPTYYQVTWNLRSPTDYSALTGNSNGGLDSETAWQINSTIMTTGTAAVVGTPLTNGDTIVINGYSIQFTNADTITTILSKINAATTFTNVAASQQVAGGYVTLMNAPGFEGTPFWIAAGVGTALSTLGLTAGTYSNYPSTVGTAFTSVTTDSNVTINGVNISFTGGPLTTAGVSTQMNSLTAQTSVVAQPAGPYLQLTSVKGEPYTINSGNAFTNMGFTLGNYGGFPSTLANSQAKERANMRWTQMISELQSFATTNMLGSISRTGNIGNVATDTITFTVGYDQPDAVRVVALSTEPDAGTVYTGTAAVKRAVARALVASMVSNRKLFNPTLENFGAGCDRPNAANIESIQADGLTSVASITTIEQNITVTQISGV
jgi:hypothetical protein